MGEPGIRYKDAILKGRGTRGTETSKYPEEKKTKVIPRVAASERGEAQTELRLGVEGPRDVKSDSRRTAWEGRPKKVRALYLKEKEELAVS